MVAVTAGVVVLTATDVLAAVPVTGAAPAGLTRTVVVAPQTARVVRTGPVTVARVARSSAATARGVASARPPKTGGAARARGADAPSAAVRRRALVARTAPNDPPTIPVIFERRIVRARSALRTSTRT